MLPQNDRTTGLFCIITTLFTWLFSLINRSLCHMPWKMTKKCLNLCWFKNVTRKRLTNQEQRVNTLLLVSYPLSWHFLNNTFCNHSIPKIAKNIIILCWINYKRKNHNVCRARVHKKMVVQLWCCVINSYFSP